MDIPDIPDYFYTGLTDYRGGCRCMHPNAAPPCSACTNAMTDEEASVILTSLAGLMPRHELFSLQTILIDNGYDANII
jgi:hypothetical protein